MFNKDKLTGGPSAPGIPGKPGFPVGPQKTRQGGHELNTYIMICFCFLF